MLREYEVASLPSTARVTEMDVRPALFWATTVHSPESCGKAGTMIRDWVPSSLTTILWVWSLTVCCPERKIVESLVRSTNSFWRSPLCCTHHCGTSTSQALVCPQPSGQIWRFVPQNIYMMKASWQKQACRVFLAEPHQSHLADEQENVQVNDWENGQVSGSESEEMWTWESIHPCHFPNRQCSLFQALWMCLLFKKSFTWSSALLAVVWIAEVLLFHMAPHRASQNWQHYPSCWWQTRCTRLHLRVSLQAGEGWPVHPEEPLFGNGLQP